MITLPSGNLLVESVEELPDFTSAKELYCDFETRSGDPRRGGIRPYHGDRICGIAVTADDVEKAYYIPIRHNGLFAKNLPTEPVQAWMKANLARTGYDWVNHNVKFDAHFAHVDGAEFGGRLVDTLTLSKVYYSDSLTYGLKTLCRDWVGIPMEESLKLKAYLKGIQSKDFADAPVDMLGDYACEDVQGNRQLYRFLKEKRDEAIAGVWETEIKLTPVLYDMEQTGMPVDSQELLIENYKVLQRLIQLADELRELLGYELNPKSPPQIYDLFVNQMALPILAWKILKDPKTGKYTRGNPTFDKKALKLYQAHPDVLSDKRKKRIIQLVALYREESQYLSLFVETYRELNINGILHPTYNQAVRTGRMSCSSPNAQQLNKRAKKLIKCLINEGLLSYDYSQIEYRLIVHYIQDMDAIAAYAQDPKTDFHQFVADQCGIGRKSAKNLNFAIGYGAGKAKVLGMLSTDPDLVDAVSKTVLTDGQTNDLATEFAKEMNRLSLKTYNDYHERLPSLRTTSHNAMQTAKRRGYVFNAYGRRRHLPPSAAHRAFNSIIQPCAADVMKERLVAVSPRYNPYIRSKGLKLMINVHDETVFRGPKESTRDPEVQKYIKNLLEDTTIKFRVPIVVNGGMSEKNWNEASGDVTTTYDEAIGGPIEWEVDSVGDETEMSGVGFE